MLAAANAARRLDVRTILAGDILPQRFAHRAEKLRRKPRSVAASAGLRRFPGRVFCQ